MKLIGHLARAGACVALLCGTATAEQASGLPPSYVELSLLRVDDFDDPEVPFRMEIDVVIRDVQDVISVEVVAVEDSVFMQDEGNGRWSGSLDFQTQNDMAAIIDGFWAINVDFVCPAPGGGCSYFSGFSLDLVELAPLFATPTNVSPENGSTDIPLDQGFSWSDPTGETADGLGVEVGPPDGGAGSQDDDNILGTLSITDTSWDPPQELLPGPNQFEVGYVVFDFERAGQLFTKGGITWGNSPFAPKGYPASTPLLALGSTTAVGFSVVAGEAGFDPPDEIPAAGEPNSHATGNLDSDAAGTIDTVVTIPGMDTQVDGLMQVFRNQGNDPDGTWLGFMDTSPINVGREPSGVTVGFFDNDVHLDVAVSNAGDNNVSIFINTGFGNATFLDEVTVDVGNRPSSITTGDFNEDGDIDLAVTLEVDQDIAILLNDGDGTFTLFGGPPQAVPPLGLAPVSITSGDFDGNKDPDVAGVGSTELLSGSAGKLFVLFGQGDGSFSAPLIIDIGLGPSDIAIGDFNGDGLSMASDIAVTNQTDGTVSVVLNTGSGGTFATPFTIPVGGNPRSIGAVNLAGDSGPDLAIAADDPDIGPSVQVLINRTSSPPGEAGGDPVVFDPPLAFSVEGDPPPESMSFVGGFTSPNSVVLADLDVDGLVDMITVNADDDGVSGGSVSALINDLETVSEADCPGDLNGDGFVNILDVLLLLDAWGECPDCPEDLDGDGHVGIMDLLIQLHQFGPCPGGDPCPWDVNGDGEVTLEDFFDVLDHIGPCETSDCPWDIDGNGFVGLADLLLVLVHIGDCP